MRTVSTALSYFRTREGCNYLPQGWFMIWTSARKVPRESRRCSEILRELRENKKNESAFCRFPLSIPSYEEEYWLHTVLAWRLPVHLFAENEKERESVELYCLVVCFIREWNLQGHYRWERRKKTSRKRLMIEY